MHLHFDSFPELTTDRLVLRALSQNDAAEIFMLRSNGEVNKFIGRKMATTIDDATQFINTITEGAKKSGSFYWGITMKNDPMLIGTICYWNIEPEKKCAEIGYELLPLFQGKGVMQEAIQKVIRFGFENMRLEMITADTHYDHKSSIKLLEKNNFKSYQQPVEAAKDADNYLSYALKTGKFYCKSATSI